jgi:hypothetical protein
MQRRQSTRRAYSGYNKRHTPNYYQIAFARVPYDPHEMSKVWT